MYVVYERNAEYGVQPVSKDCESIWVDFWFATCRAEGRCGGYALGIMDRL